MSASPPAVALRAARYVGTLRILTVNDVYSARPVDGLGGWAQLSTLLQQYRTPNSILCVNGDFLGGSQLAEHFSGANVVRILDALHTDAVVLGNHEFDYGAAPLKQRMQESDFVWLGSNVRERATEDTPESDSTLFPHVTDTMQIRMQLHREDLAEAAALAAESSSATASASASASSSSPSPAPPTSLFPEVAAVTMGMFGVCTSHTPQLSWPGKCTSFTPVPPVAEECIAKLKGTGSVKVPQDMPVIQLPRAIPADAAAPTNQPSSPSAASPSAAASSAFAPPPAAVLSAASSQPVGLIHPSDLILAVTHLSNNEDRKLARAYGAAFGPAGGINVIIGGHDHDAVALMEGSTLVFKAGQNATWLGVIDLRIELTLTERPTDPLPMSPAPGSPAPPTAVSSSISAMPTHSPASEPYLRSVSAYPSWAMVANRAIYPDPLIADRITADLAEMERAQAAGGNPDEIICRIGEPSALPEGVATLSDDMAANLLLTRTSAVRAASSSFADMVADAMAAHYAEFGCDGAIINGGFVRGDKSYAIHTDLTLRDVRYELPFPKVVVLIKITGRNILLALNEMLAPHPTPSGSYPHVSAAFRVEFDGSSDLLGSKQKVSAVWHKDQPLEMDRVYKLAVTTFMAAGGDGVTGFATGTVISNDSFPVAELVLRYLRGVQILHPNLRTRVKPMGMFRNNN